MNQDQVPIEVNVWDFETESYQLSLDFGSYLDIRIIGGETINHPTKVLSKEQVFRLYNGKNYWTDIVTGEKYTLSFLNAKSLPEEWRWVIDKYEGRDFILREGLRERHIALLASVFVKKEHYTAKYSFFLIGHKEVECCFNLLWPKTRNY